MKKRVAKILSIALVGAMAVSMAACGNKGGNDAPANNAGSATEETAAASSDINVGIVVKTSENAHFQDIAYGAKLAGKELGIGVTVQNTASESEVNEQVQKCENLITQGVDALILTANDSDGVSQAVEEANEKGIPFITVDTEITNIWGDEVADYLPTYIGVNHEEMAYDLAKEVIEKKGSADKVIIIEGNQAATSSNERTAGFKRALAEYNAEAIDDQAADYDMATAADKMGNLIQSHPDVEIVLCCNDLMAVGVVQALEENNVEVGPDGVLVAGIDGNFIALQSIEKNEIYASAYDWSLLQGYYAVMQAYDLINGNEISTPGLEAQEDGTYRTTAPDTIITADNVADFLPHGQELDEWPFGDDITSVSQDMSDFVDTGKSLME